MSVRMDSDWTSTDCPWFRDGVITLPERPGLGVELDRGALERFKVA
jgi:L-alanine-DL-glutamate epimerase-like enolase superfamily enzyme